tara:strand:- start:997 stop:1818 length:822 start_codon:yes stop_codon:yes gene_type:complete
MQTYINKKFNLIIPLKFENLKRYGGNGDGGYVCESSLIKGTDILISFGMGSDWSFELDCIKDNSKVKIFMYDHTVTILPYLKDVLKYFKRFITLRGKPNALNNRVKNLKDYLSFIFLKNVFFYKEKIIKKKINKRETNIEKVFERIDEKNNTKEKSIILKCDIEGSEFDIIEDIIKYSHRINTLIFEFHWLNQNEEIFLDVIKKLQKKFVVAHIHGNNHCDKLSNGLPEALEMTLINKKFAPRKKILITSFPIEGLDMPNNPNKEDLYFQFSV